MMQIDENYDGYCENCMEDQLRAEKHRRIGWAIMQMGYWERLRWALTGKNKYMNFASCSFHYDDVSYEYEIEKLEVNQ